ncbi:MAG: hypothetical protein K2Q22_11790 [Cytophagales bacterium]|nr:hypothetical protein [Cytophagales bacterium]
MDGNCIYCGGSLESKSRIFSTFAEREFFRTYTLSRASLVNPPLVCFDCYLLQAKHNNFYEKSTIQLLNFKIAIVIVLFVTGYISSNTYSVNDYLNSGSSNGYYPEFGQESYRDSKGQKYGTSEAEIIRRNQEINSRLNALDTMQSGVAKSPFKKSLIDN